MIRRRAASRPYSAATRGLVSRVSSSTDHDAPPQQPSQPFVCGAPLGSSAVAKLQPKMYSEMSSVRGTQMALPNLSTDALLSSPITVAFQLSNAVTENLPACAVVRSGPNFPADIRAEFFTQTAAAQPWRGHAVAPRGALHPASGLASSRPCKSSALVVDPEEGETGTATLRQESSPLGPRSTNTSPSRTARVSIKKSAQCWKSLLKTRCLRRASCQIHLTINIVRFISRISGRLWSTHCRLCHLLQR